MVRVISQETFDAVVRENVDDLGMAQDEAVKDAVEQFKAQGMELSNISIPGSGAPGGDHPVLAALAKLDKALAEGDSANKEDMARTADQAAAELAKYLIES